MNLCNRDHLVVAIRNGVYEYVQLRIAGSLHEERAATLPGNL
jgi:hypothetical protein